PPPPPATPFPYTPLFRSWAWRAANRPPPLTPCLWGRLYAGRRRRDQRPACPGTPLAGMNPAPQVLPPGPHPTQSSPFPSQATHVTASTRRFDAPQHAPQDSAIPSGFPPGPRSHDHRQENHSPAADRRLTERGRAPGQPVPQRRAGHPRAAPDLGRGPAGHPAADLGPADLRAREPAAAARGGDP